MESWFIYNPMIIIIFSLFSTLVWLITKSEELKRFEEKGKLLGAAVALSSGFTIGLLCFVTLILYAYFVWVLELWIKRYNNKKEAVK